MAKKDWEDFLEVGVFSLLSYTIYYLGIQILNKITDANGTFTSYQALFDEKIPIAGYEVIIASLIGAILSFIGSFAHTHKLINKFGRFVKVTKKFGEEDVWDFFHNMPDVEWVFVRDHKLDLVYYGRIFAFSDSGKERELLLTDIDVYKNSTGDFLYQSRAMYISRDRYDMTIEVPKLPEESSDSQ